MNWAEQVVNEFGRSLGLHELSFDAHASIRLDAADNTGIGLFLITRPPQQEVVVYRSIPTTYLSPAQYRAALQSVNFRNPYSWPLQATCDQKELMIAMRIPERSFMVSTLEKTLNDLALFFEKILQKT